MGLSVSAATGIIVLAMVISVSFIGLTLAQSFDNLKSAGEGRLSFLIDREKTCIMITNVNYSSPVLEIYVANCGSLTIDVSLMSVLLDGTLVKGKDIRWSVEGKKTDLLLHGEMLTITVKGVPTEPSTIKVVTGNGVEAYW